MEGSDSFVYVVIKVKVAIKCNVALTAVLGMDSELEISTNNLQAKN